MPTCGSCGSEWRSGEDAVHLSGCATMNTERELERRAQQRRDESMLARQQHVAFIAEMNAEMNRVINPPIIFEGGQFDVRPGGVTSTGLPSSQIGDTRWALPEGFYTIPPRTSADMPSELYRGRHDILEYPIMLPSGEQYQCSCGWKVTGAYLEGLSEREVRGMLEAHRAGGQVGPQQKPVELIKKRWTTPEISEPSLTPRRHFKLELDQ